MRERQTQMSFRVFPSERDTITRKAKEIGMNISEYIRTCALNKEIRKPPSPDFSRLYHIVRKLHDRFRYEDGFDMTNADLTEAEEILLKIYHGKE